MSLLQPRCRTAILSGTLGLSAAYTLRSQPLFRLENVGHLPSTHCQIRSSTRRYRPDAKVVRQISAGSISGVVTGLAVSFLSKSLALILGLFITGVYAAESYGIHVIPYRALQKYVSGVDLNKFIKRDPAFKLTFGLAFALTGFMGFSAVAIQ
ncbi:hypothetical protein K470DRAFT_251842 [Piedraia hortae CBS 480.64]|uniref:FUN14-domain-containing protein n=1 Tax=Piedraia hortae CBS 480.64 TaxID=1314780 RepID=A0A6A7BTX2_9PEZI|nr:hypothetical protein K470DRAFT_251842 [Piedraia hortae CBS 480.64]